jgi:hypothetical protein
MASRAFRALERGPARPAVEGLGAAATGDLGEGDEALLGDVELAAELPVFDLEEVAGSIAWRHFGLGILPSVFAALCLPHALPGFALHEAGRLVDVERMARYGVVREGVGHECGQTKVAAGGEYLADGERARVILKAGDDLLECEGTGALFRYGLDAFGEPELEGSAFPRQHGRGGTSGA